MDSKQATMKGSNFDLKGTNFCLRCGAWRGSLGLEPTPELYIKHLLEIFNEIKRVLKKTGTCWVNLGDSYSGSWGNRSHRPETKNLNKLEVMDPEMTPPTAKLKHIPAKSLIGIPEMFVLGMRDKGWIRRNTLIWYKRNCMPSSTKDRFTVDFEYVYFFTKTGKYWFEQQFEKYKQSSIERADGSSVTTSNPDRPVQFKRILGPLGRNKRCVWDISTSQFSEAHFAVFPEALVEPMIRAGCPESGIVLDPFCGSGTTLKVAIKLNRHWIGIDLNPKYIEISKKRIKEVQINAF